MTQQINLYGPQLRPVRDRLPARRMAGVAAAALLALGGLGGWDAWQLQQARVEAQRARETLAAQQVEVADLARAIGARRSDPQLEQELARVEALHKARAQIKALLDSDLLGAPGGFAEPMRALARQSSTGLWLTGFTLAPAQVELQGRALSAELVPAYLRRLGQEKALAGVTFGALRIAQPAAPRSETTTAAGLATGGAPARASAVAFVEFQVAGDARAIDALAAGPRGGPR